MASNVSEEEAVVAVPDLNSAAEHLEPSPTVPCWSPSQNLPNPVDENTETEGDAGAKAQDGKDRTDAENVNLSVAVDVGVQGLVGNLIDDLVKENKMDADETEVAVEVNARSAESGLVEEIPVDVGEAEAMAEDDAQTANTGVALTEPVDSEEDKDDENVLDRGNDVDSVGVVVDVVSDASAGAEQEVPKKRGRGRPRKYPANKSREKKVEARVQGSSENRKRGRPRKSDVQTIQGKNCEVVEPESLQKRKRGRPPKSSVLNTQGENVLVKEVDEDSSQVRKRGKLSHTILESTELVRYMCHFQDEKDGYAVTDLVWGKVRSHPWWPGQIVDVSNASEIALKIQKDNHILIAYFGDNSFAWCDESQLKPFQAHFTLLEKQSGVGAFVTAVDDALEEVSRRVKLGMACNCFANEAYDSLKDQKIINSGLQKGACVSAIDKMFIVDAFEPERLTDFIQVLALSPYEGADRLDLTISKAQLESFFCLSRCLLGLPAHVPDILYEGLEDEDEDEDEDESSPASKEELGKEMSDSTTPNSSDSVAGKGKSRSGVNLSQKQNPVTGNGRKKKSLSELMEDNPHLKASESGKTKRKKLDSLGDLKANLKQAKFGEHMQHVAGLMEDLTPMLMSNEETFRECLSEVNRISKDNLSLTELLGELSEAARDPMKADGFLSKLVSFFTDFRDSLTPSSLEYLMPAETVGAKRSRRSLAKKSASSHSATPGYVQDSYWSDIIVSDNAEEEPASKGHKRKGECWTTRQWKRKQEESAVSHSLDHNLVEEQDLLFCSTSTNTLQELEAERPLSISEDVEECMPTELVLTFGESDGLPFVTDLVRLFGHYGPLREAETEVVEKENTAKVVFKRRADAEAVFNSAGKYNLFKQASVSYRLRHLESASKASPKGSSDITRDVLPVEDSGGLEVSGQNVMANASHIMHVEVKGSSQ